MRAMKATELGVRMQPWVFDIEELKLMCPTVIFT
ncbi:hypothetical protein SEEGA711_09887 [Salmonella enterica subsp. enterica serovar Gaminara str. ATCC BAA-711]|nr:hypothetical protein SEEGA711_09887 [Salmonella enterica subsp. enterica serovar Gaminara str. ATCC BAA-711]